MASRRRRRASADEPSRVDLSSVRWRVLACPELVSEPVPVSWPQEDNWRDPAGWAREAGIMRRMQRQTT